MDTELKTFQKRRKKGVHKTFKGKEGAGSEPL